MIDTDNSVNLGRCRLERMPERTLMKNDMATLHDSLSNLRFEVPTSVTAKSTV
jgi:hypothetical protein